MVRVNIDIITVFDKKKFDTIISGYIHQAKFITVNFLMFASVVV